MNAAKDVGIRFWVPRSGHIDLSDGGFLMDPALAFFRSSSPPPASLRGLKSYRALALLGEPGMGKSTELQADAERLAMEVVDGSTISIRVDLRDFSSEALFCKRVFESSRITEWKAGAQHLVLHLDSLDEVLLKSTA